MSVLPVLRVRVELKLEKKTERDEKRVERYQYRKGESSQGNGTNADYQNRNPRDHADLVHFFLVVDAVRHVQ